MRAAVLGSPIGHSLSPAMHRAAYAHLGLGWDYGRHEVDEQGLPGFLARLDDSWRGLSLTMPLKEQALALAQEADPVARLVGGANTLVRRADGSWEAHNTDVHGIAASLADHGVRAAGRVLLLGSGATARSALVALRDLGTREVALAVRAAARPETLALAERIGTTPRTHPLDAVPDLVGEVDLVVDTLPGRAADSVAAGLRAGPAVALPPLLEVVYEGWPTPLAQVFAEAGAQVVSGLEMLAHQAAAQVRLMTGRDVPAPVLLDAARAALG